MICPIDEDGNVHPFGLKRLNAKASDTLCPNVANISMNIGRVMTGHR